MEMNNTQLTQAVIQLTDENDALSKKVEELLTTVGEYEDIFMLIAEEINQIKEKINV